MADVQEVTTVVGREEVRAGRIFPTRVSGSFEYASDHLRRRDAFALAPAPGAVDHGAEAVALKTMHSRIDAAVAAVHQAHEP